MLFSRQGRIPNRSMATGPRREQRINHFHTGERWPWPLPPTLMQPTKAPPPVETATFWQENSESARRSSKLTDIAYNLLVKQWIRPSKGRKLRWYSCRRCHVSTVGLHHPKTIRPPLHFEFIIAGNVRGKDDILQHFLFMRRGYWAGWENNMRDWTGQHHLWGAHHKRSALYWILWVVQLWPSYFVHPGARVNTSGVQDMAALIPFDLFNLPKIYHRIHLVRLVNELYYTLLCFKLNLKIAHWCIFDVRTDVLQLYSGNYFKYVQINIYYYWKCSNTTLFAGFTTNQA